MSTSMTPNQARGLAIRLSRYFVALFRGVPDRFAPLLTRWVWRWLFLSADGQLHRGGRIVLRDLGRFARVHQLSNFSSDPLVMARREGRREVFARIQYLLNLNETEIRKMMENDDGI